GVQTWAFPILFSKTNGNGRAETPAIGNLAINTIPEPAPYSSELQPFHRNDSLAVDNGWVGHLQDVDTKDGTAGFHPLQLPSLQKARAEAYIGARDAYHRVYDKEDESYAEHRDERETLNRLYDACVKRSGSMNEAKNIELIKTDSVGKEMP